MTETVIHHYTLPYPMEPWTLLAVDDGICAVLYPDQPPSAAEAWLSRHLSSCRLQQDAAPFREFGILDRMDAYFAGEPVSFTDIPMTLWGTPFQRKVWTALGHIPYGEVRTYRQIAEAIGQPAAARAVGTANGRNPLPLLLPCHRVIGTDGTMTGYRGGLRRKKTLLELEGITHVEAAGHARFDH